MDINFILLARAYDILYIFPRQMEAIVYVNGQIIPEKIVTEQVCFRYLGPMFAMIASSFVAGEP